MKHVFKWMNGYGENAKMADSDGGRFLGNRAPKLAKTTQACCDHLVQLPVKQFCKWMHGFQVM